MKQFRRPIQFFKLCTYPGIQPGRYMIGDNGDIYDIVLNRFKCLTPHKTTGYVNGKFIMNDGSRKTIVVHRLVAWEFVPGYNEALGTIYVDHINFDKSDNDYINLEWVTISENNRRRYLNENNVFSNPPTYYGQDNPTAKYDNNTVIQICELLEKGLTVKEIFTLFGYRLISDNMSLYYLINDIKNGKSWLIISKNYTFVKGSTTIETTL